MEEKKRFSMWRRLVALTALFGMALCISIVMTPVFIISDWFDYCSNGKWSESVDDIWNGKH